MLLSLFFMAGLAVESPNKLDNSPNKYKETESKQEREYRINDNVSEARGKRLST